MAARFAEIPAPVPELEPHGFLSSAYGFFVWPPRPLHPLIEWFERIFAHSLKFVFPRMTAPASRSFLAMNASAGGFDPRSASDPAVVCILSAVAMLSLMSTGIPWSGPRGPFSFRSLSSASAISSASGLVSMTLLTRGPLLSTAAMRSRYSSAMDRALCFPDFIPSCSASIVISSSSKAATSAASLASLSRGAAKAGCKTGATARAAPPSKLACKNFRRPGVALVSDSPNFTSVVFSILGSPGPLSLK